LTGIAAASLPRPAMAIPATTRARPGSAAWPKPADWAALSRAVGGRLAPVRPPTLDPSQAPQLLQNPYFLRDQAGLTQSSGWVDAWRSAPSAYAVRAASAADVAAAIRFAAAHNLRLVVKGGGHSYLGGSNAPDSLLVWTRDLNTITLHDTYPEAGPGSAPTPAVTLGAGCIWHDAYDAVTTEAGRYVQGGGCVTVGVAGLVQGGGFGSFSKGFGLAAASLLAAEIVTADGAIRHVDATRDPDLFWALQGGGGGSFGVVTQLTLRTHALPALFGAVHWYVAANTDAALQRLLAAFLKCYAQNLFNPHWGEQARVTHRNRLEIDMMFQGLSAAEAQAAWADLQAFVAAHPADFTITELFRLAVLPARALWDGAFLRAHAPTAIVPDPRPGARAGDWWWHADAEQAGTFWHGYHSLWLPQSLLRPDARARLVSAWFAASRHWSVALHFNKGLAGGAPGALAASARTAMNPQVLDAFALAIIAMDGPSAYVSPPDLADARDDAAAMRRAEAALRQVAPAAGSYLSECDYHLADWQTACWGDHWRRLQAIKQRYDPAGLFIVHHGVGSQYWSADGFTPVKV
jgi:FAD/FMN-containing dehydrogenase